MRRTIKRAVCAAAPERGLAHGRACLNPGPQARPAPSERGSCAEAESKPCTETGNKGQAMMIERTAFGAITVDGKTYEHDVIIRLSGEVVKRKKKLSKKYYGTSHVLSRVGQMGNLHLSPEAEAYFAKKGCKVLLRPTPKAIRAFNKSHARKVGLFHVTC